MKHSTKSRAAVTKLLDAINNENFQDTNYEDKPTENKFTVKKVLTDQCIPWKFANRMKEFVNEESCSDLINSIRSSGQKIPVIARKYPKSDKYEIICGIRRLYACNTLKTPILTAIVDVDDKEALLIMDVENRSRLDISPYERAIDYKNWIDCGIYKNYKEIQQQTGIKKSWFSQLMALSEIHQDIVDIFGNPKNLKQKWGYTLRTLCKDKENETKILEAVKKLKYKTYQPRTIYSKLLKACSVDNNIQSDETIIRDSNNMIVLKAKRTSIGGLNIIINKSLETKEATEMINTIKSLLE